MKKNNESKKLVLNKITIQDLDTRQMDSVKGGSVITLAVGPCATVTKVTCETDD